MHDVPRESVGEHLGLGKVQEDGRDELDQRVARMSSFLLSTCGI
jgi:histone deacetylase 1/2